MEKTTLLFLSLIDLARYSREVTTGYLMNTNKYTLTGKFTPEEIAHALSEYKASIIETSEKVFTY